MHFAPGYSIVRLLWRLCVFFVCGTPNYAYAIFVIVVFYSPKDARKVKPVVVLLFCNC